MVLFVVFPIVQCFKNDNFLATVAAELSFWPLNFKFFYKITRIYSKQLVQALDPMLCGMWARFWCVALLDCCTSSPSRYLNVVVLTVSFFDGLSVCEMGLNTRFSTYMLVV